jgi:hypothetical protein
MYIEVAAVYITDIPAAGESMATLLSVAFFLNADIDSPRRRVIRVLPKNLISLTIRCVLGRTDSSLLATEGCRNHFADFAYSSSVTEPAPRS